MEEELMADSDQKVQNSHEYIFYELRNCEIVRNCILEYQYISYGALKIQIENLNASSVQAVIKLIQIQKV